MESFTKKYSTKPRKSQALTWGLGTNTLPSIFSGDLSKVYHKFLSLLQGPRNYIDRTRERSANYSARTFSCSCYRAKPKWSSTIDMSGDTQPLICIWLNSSHLQVSTPCSALNSSTGNKAKLSLRAVWRLFSNLRPTQLIAILLRHFWFPAIARTRKAGACTVISRSFARSVNIVVWPVQRWFAYPVKFHKLFNDRGELRSNLGYSTSFLRNQEQQCRNRVH